MVTVLWRKTQKQHSGRLDRGRGRREGREIEREREREVEGRMDRQRAR